MKSKYHTPSYCVGPARAEFKRMVMQTVILCSFSIVFFLFGCSGGTTQDPLAKQPENVRQGIPPSDKPREDRNPIPREAMRLEIEPEIPNFVENQEGVLKISGTILGFLEEAFEIEIKNLPKGASYDQGTGKMVWTPEADVVIGNDYMAIYELVVQISTLRSPVLSMVRKVPLFVQRNVERPEIISVDSPVEVVEGTMQKMTVTVRDLDSSDGTLFIFREPHLTFVQIENTLRDGSSLIRLANSTTSKPNPVRMDPKDPKYDPNVWIYSLIVDARDKELTGGRDLFNFGLIATSRFGRPSAEGGVPSKPRLVSLPIISKVPRALTTWPDTILQVKENERAVINFDVYAPIGALGFRAQPEGDGVLDPVEIKKNCHPLMPGTAECKCSRDKSWRYQCTMTWQPPKSQETPPNDPTPTPPSARLTSFDVKAELERYPIAFRVINRNAYRPSDFEISEFVRHVEIVKDPVVVK